MSSKRGKGHKNAHDLHQDQISVVLGRLPVKSLLRFKCVCRPWRDMIDSPYFVNSHAYLAKKSESAKIMLATSLGTLDVIDIYPPKRSVHRRIARPTRRRFTFVGTCNGLICSAVHVAAKKYVIAVWNPSTQQFRERVTIDHSRVSDVDIPGRFGYGFGHDRKTDDYKFVLMENNYSLIESLFVIEFSIYSMRSDSWSSNRKLIKSLSRVEQPVYASGALHCLLELRDLYCVAAFDLGTEDWSDMIPLPTKNIAWRLGALGDSVCCTCYNPAPGSRDVWVMVACDGGTFKSWNKLFTLVENMSINSDLLWPFGLVKCGGQIALLMREQGMRKWFDIEKKILRHLGLPDKSYVEDAVAYFESLVPV